MKMIRGRWKQTDNFLPRESDVNLIVTFFESMRKKGRGRIEGKNRKKVHKGRVKPQWSQWRPESKNSSALSNSTEQKDTCGRTEQNKEKMVWVGCPKGFLKYSSDLRHRVWALCCMKNEHIPLMTCGGLLLIILELKDGQDFNKKNPLRQ